MPVKKCVGKKRTTYFIDFYAGGKRYRERVGSSKKAAEIKLGKRLKEIEDGTFNDQKIKRLVSFEDLANEYDKIAKAKKGYSTGKYRIAFLREWFKGRSVREIGVMEVEQFQRDLAALPKKTGGKRSETDVNRTMGVLRAMLNNAVRWEMIEKNPVSKVKFFPESSGRNKFLSVEEAGRLLDACHPHFRPIVLCALWTGMRKSEITGLRWPEIHREMIYLPGERTKNGKPREVPISERLSEEFKKLRRQQLQGGGATDLVFKAHRGRPSEDGTRRLKVLTSPVRSFRHSWEAARLKAGIDPDFHFHDIRHTTASWLKMSGADDLTVMDIMGHSDFKMMKRYAHLSPEHKRKAIERLSNWGGEETDGQILDGKMIAEEKGLQAECP